jgi:hypothetical protein
MVMGKKATKTKWIQMARKPNEDFLAKPKGTHKCTGNMIIDNIKNKPDFPRTDNINVILQNFVKYYAKLYEHKGVCPITLKKLITNLTLNLDDKEVEKYISNTKGTGLVLYT